MRRVALVMAGAVSRSDASGRPMATVWSARRTLVRLAIAAVLGALTAGCNPAPVNVAVQRLAPLSPGEIRRIAVLPFTAGELAGRQPPQPSQEPFAEPPAETVTRAMDDALRRLPGWALVDPLVVSEALRRLYGEVRPPTPAEAQAIGKLLGVDAVLSGQVTAFEERVGVDLAVQTPARVVFAVELLRIPSGKAVWRAEYAEKQQALSENLWNLAGFLHAGGRWVRARELAALGAEQVADQLHAALYGRASSGAAAPAH
jgi:TolB-like protein